MCQGDVTANPVDVPNYEVKINNQKNEDGERTGFPPTKAESQ